MPNPPPRSKGLLLLVVSVRDHHSDTDAFCARRHLLLIVVVFFLVGTAAPSTSALLLQTSTRQPAASQSLVFHKRLNLVNVDDDNLDDRLVVKEESLSLTKTMTLSEPTRTTNERRKHRRPRIAILRYSDHWVCINKPVGLSVHRGSIDHTQSRTQTTVVSTLKRQLRRKVWPVHRLDHRTSGAMLLAFDSSTAAKLQKSLQASRKLYMALLRGEWNLDEHSVTIDQPITHDGVTKEAQTIFHKLAVWKNDDNTDSCNRSCTLVLAEPVTGRTHQIRRHAARHLHMPVLGDTQHGDTKVNRHWRLNHHLHRLALHCFEIQNLGPVAAADGVVLDVTAPIPEDLRTVLESLDPLWRAAVVAEPSLATGWIDERGGTLGDRRDWQRAQDLDNLDSD